MTRSIRRVGLGVTVLLVALVAQLTYLQVVAADRLEDDPRNVRTLIRDFARPRGPIVTADGEIVARSVPVDDEFEFQREYPLGGLFAHVSGYQSFVVGNTGVENRYNDELVGRDLDIQIESFDPDRLFDDEQATGTVVLSLTQTLQEVARDSLGNRRGSVVALDPKSGAILAMYSNPSFDPQPLAGHNAEEVQFAFNFYNGDPANPLLPRAYRERYAPGSTFKVVTTGIALDAGVTSPEQTYPSISALDLPLTDNTLANFGGDTCGGTLVQSFINSCNTTFGQIGLDLGDQLAVGIDQFGVTSAAPLDLDPGAAPGSGPEPGTFQQQAPQFALAAIGQGDVFTVPLEMALVAASVANGGVMMRPHVAAEIRDAQDGLVRTIEAEPWRTAMSPATATTVGGLMLGVVQEGTGTAAQIPGVAVAGKTGTAQVPGQDPSAWFVAFAPADNPTIAIAVVVEQGGDLGSEATGGAVAAPIARNVIAAHLGR